ncbi:MAG: GNAT family N-acetyltransferase [Acidobacteriota bacterium]|nr:GNAT family N-acetyltransferase [Acidobacteriota bacterium]
MAETIQDQILKILKTGKSGLQMEEVAEKIGLTRHTVAKYLEVLRAEGKIHYSKFGRTKLWKDVSAAITTRLLGLEDLNDILRIAETIEREDDTEKADRMASLKETAVYQLQHGEPLLNLGAEIDGRLVGFIFGEIKLWEFGRAEKTGWIKVLGVDREFQGMGVGNKMGEMLLSHFQKKSVRKVRTLVDWYEGDLISYFKSLGFNMLNMMPLEREI